MTGQIPLKLLIAVADWKARLAIESASKGPDFSVSLASNSDEAGVLVALDQPDVVVMDLRLPPMGGIRLCEKLRSAPASEGARLVVLGDSEDRASELAALNAGADAYLSRQLDAASLLEQVVAVEPREPAEPDPKVLRAGLIEMVPEQWAVSVGRDPVHLTEIEYRLLQELLQVKGRVLTRETLMERVWGHSRAVKLETRTLDVHMSRLRNKLRSASESIITVRNVGYRIDVFPDWLGR
ncbi:MAG: response regulator transcription factor [Xanthomonadales bacterium]|nr:response regulator transcription factor [Xanthomonadales bacterium]